MKLVKLAIWVENAPFPIKVLFNPNKITITGSGWHTDEKTGLASLVKPGTLAMDLFFDTSLPRPTANSPVGWAVTNLLGAGLPSLALPEDVRKYTKPICELTTIRGSFRPPRPPICELKWGDPRRTFFRGVLKDVTQTFTRFLEDGTPVRANLSCNFEEWESATTQAKAKNQIDDPVRVVKRGETLSSIAAEEYGDATLWRVIAEANRGLIPNPRQLAPGTVLTVPPLHPVSDTQRRS